MTSPYQFEQFQTVPFSDQFYETLNSLDTGKAISWLERHMEFTIKMRDIYQEKMLACDGKSDEFKGFVHSYWVDCNAIYRLKVLLDEVRSEQT